MMQLHTNYSLGAHYLSNRLQQKRGCYYPGLCVSERLTMSTRHKARKKTNYVRNFDLLLLFDSYICRCLGTENMFHTYMDQDYKLKKQKQISHIYKLVRSTVNFVSQNVVHVCTAQVRLCKDNYQKSKCLPLAEATKWTKNNITISERKYRGKVNITSVVLTELQINTHFGYFYSMTLKKQTIYINKISEYKTERRIYQYTMTKQRSIHSNSLNEL